MTEKSSNFQTVCYSLVFCHICLGQLLKNYLTIPTSRWCCGAPPSSFWPFPKPRPIELKKVLKAWKPFLLPHEKKEIWIIISHCGNCRIFISIRFYVKSILQNLEVLKLTFFAILGALNFISAFKKCKNAWKSKCRAYNCIKMADFALLEFSKSFSRNIWVIEKSWNFHNW